MPVSSPYTKEEQEFIFSQYEVALGVTEGLQGKACTMVAEDFLEKFQRHRARTVQSIAKAIQNMVYRKTREKQLPNTIKKKRKSKLNRISMVCDQEYDYLMIFKGNGMSGATFHFGKNENEINEKLAKMMDEYPGTPTVTFFKRIQPKVTISL